MSESADLEARLERVEALLASNQTRRRRLEDIEAIKRLKYRYFRAIDLKQWADLAECFAEDATTSYHDSRYEQQGVDEIMAFIQKGLARYEFFGFHHGHNPEIEITGDASASGVWALHNYMLDTARNRGLLIAAYYHDEYVKVDGQWKIRSTGYKRIFEEAWDRSDLPTLELVANIFASATESTEGP